MNRASFGLHGDSMNGPLPAGEGTVTRENLIEIRDSSYAEILSRSGIRIKEEYEYEKPLEVNLMNFSLSQSRFGFCPRMTAIFDHSLFSIGELTYLTTLYGEESKILSYKKDMPNLALFRQELIRFNYSLEAWWMANRKKETTYYSPKIIWEKSIIYGPQFAEQYSKEWDNQVRFIMAWTDRDEYKDNGKFYSFEHFFPIRSLFRWSEKIDDLEYYQIPVNISDTDLELLTNEIFDLLPENIRIPNDEKILDERRQTSSYDTLALERAKHYQIFNKDSYRRFGDNIIGIRTPIYVYPTGCRDSIVTDPSSLNTIAWCSKLTGEILENIPQALVGVTSEKFYERLNRLKKSARNFKNYFYLPDIRKCGITMPRQLYRCIYDALTRKYGYHQKFERYLAFEKFVLLDNDTKSRINTERGVGLGMNVNEITLILCALHELRKRECPWIIDAGYFNDDQIIVVQEDPNDDNLRISDVLSNLKIFDYQLCTRFGIIMNEKKTFSSKEFLFLEQYTHPDLHDKSSASAALFGNAFAAPNIGIAKEYYSSVGSLHEQRFNDIRTRLINYWGCEFDSSEGTRDYFLGGWNRFKVKYYNNILSEIENCKDEDIEYLSYIHEIVSARSFLKISLKIDDEESINEKSHYTHFAKTNGITLYKEIPSDLRAPITSLIASDDDYNKFYEKLDKQLRKPTLFLRKYEKLKSKIKVKKFRSAEKADLIQRQIDLYPNELYRLPEELVLSETKFYEKLEGKATFKSLIDQKAKPLDYHLTYLKENGYLDYKGPQTNIWSEDLFEITSLNLSKEGVWVDPYIEMKKDNLPKFLFALNCNPFAVLEDYIQRTGLFPTSLKYEIVPPKIKLYDFCEKYSLRKIVECPNKGIISTIVYCQGFNLEMEDLDIEDFPESFFEAINQESETEVDWFDIHNICQEHTTLNTEHLIMFNVYIQSELYNFKNRSCEVCLIGHELSQIIPGLETADSDERDRRRKRVHELRSILDEEYVPMLGYTSKELVGDLSGIRQNEEVDFGETNLFGEQDSDY
jgi:hypothetical protein